VVGQLKQAQFSGDFPGVSVQLLEPANALRAPVRPRPLLTLALALAVGCALGAAAALAAHQLGARPPLPLAPVAGLAGREAGPTSPEAPGPDLQPSADARAG